MHGDSEAIQEWRSRRSQGVSRLDTLLVDDGVQVEETGSEALVGMPDSNTGGMISSYSSSVSRSGRDDDTEEEVTRQVECMKLPKGIEQLARLGPLLDSLEPCLSGVDSRLGLRQMHLAWTCNCTCAKSSVSDSCTASCVTLVEFLPCCGRRACETSQYR